jgi:alkanesulfonate monooxygenase SsuD/methylene tetrahydromethanopterin reductase-like flavin-dependent oxidoreductase (luciferase family)
MQPLKLGMNLWSQSSDWPGFLAAARRADELGYDHIWTWDHVYAIFGDPHQDIFEGYTAIAALAVATRRARLGLFVGANTFRNPGLAAKCLVTIDHISGGRAIMGIGAAWMEPEHRAFGIDFGSGPGQRLDWLAEAAPAIRTLLDGGSVTSAPGSRYAFNDLAIHPLPLQAHLPILIGGGGEKKTLRIVAQHADMWNVSGTPEVVAHKDEVLVAHCRDVGRDPAAIERTLGCKITIRDSEAEAQRVQRELLEHNRTPDSWIEGDDSFWPGTVEQIAERMTSFRRVGFHTFVNEVAAPYDAETIERLVMEVKPLVEAAGIPA